MRSQAPLGRLLVPALRAQPDRRLVTLAREGSEAASEEIVRRYRPALVRYAATIVPGDRADDVVQDSLTKALPRLADGEGEMHLRSWLYTIVRNTALNELRDAPPPHEQIDENYDGVEQPPQALERRQSVRRLVTGMRSLPAAQREALVKRELEGRSHEEISAELGVSAGAARQLIFRARESLRQALGSLVPMPLLRYLLEGGGDGAVSTAVAGSGGAVAIKAAVAIFATGAVVAGGGAVKRVDKPDRPAVAEQVRIAPSSAGEEGHGEAPGDRGRGRSDNRGEDRSAEAPEGDARAEDRRAAEHGGGGGPERGGGGPGPDDDDHGSAGTQEGDDRSGGDRSSRGGSEGSGQEEHIASSGSGPGSGRGSSGGGSHGGGADSTDGGGPGSGGSGSGGPSGSGGSGGSGSSDGADSSHDSGSTEQSGSSASGGGPGTEAEAISEPPRDSGGGTGLSGETDQPPQEDE